MNTFRHTLRYSWTRFWHLHKHRDEPGWARWLIALGLGVGIGSAMLILGALLDRDGRPAGWWKSSLVYAWLIGCIISVSIMGVYRVLELRLSEAQLSRLNGRPTGLSALFFAAIPIGCSAMGLMIGAALIQFWEGKRLQTLRLPDLGQVLVFVTIAGLMSAATFAVARARWRQRELAYQASEAQLRLLQAQIEPHFLFNTLANLESLIDHDTAQAKTMLIAFTDYLRSSLQQLRRQDASVAEEMDVVRNYLDLMRCRMHERLHYSFSVPAAATALRLPPLLVQPLVENAIHHGLEPKMDGGHIDVRVAIEGQVLRIEVRDDGLGLNSAAPRRKQGNGLALSNIRERLQARYGEAASLSLQPLDPGTLALLSLPLQANAAPGATTQLSS